MLPFMQAKRRDNGSSIAKQVNGSTMDMNSEVNAPSSGVDEGLHSAAMELIAAIEKKSPIDVAHALQAAFDICDSYEDQGDQS